MAGNNNNDSRAPSAEAVVQGNHRPPQADGRYAVDIRVFIALLVISMAVSFGVGVAMGPTATDLFEAETARASGSAKLQDGLPLVQSVHLDTPLETPEGVHEPAGQVRRTNFMALLEKHSPKLFCVRSVIFLGTAPASGHQGD